MILYNKNTEFLGASAEVLSILGYEDINAFRTYNNDIADLFVNKQGYIHKFENFSWINYVLNGSLPNRSVVIRTRSNAEIEASVSVYEIFLSNGDNDSYYVITLSNIRHLPSSFTQNADNRQPVFREKDNTVPQKIDMPSVNDQTNAASNASQDTKISFKFDKDETIPQKNDQIDTTPNVSQDTKISFKFDKDDTINIPSINNQTDITQNISQDAKVSFKFDKDDMVPQKIDMPSTNDQINTTSNASQDTKVSFKFDGNDMLPSNYGFNKIDNQVKTEQSLAGSHTQNTATEIKVDIQEISDLLGISEMDLIRYMNGYVSYLDVNVEQLRGMYQNGATPQTRKIVVNLIGIGSNLRAKEVVQALQKLLAIGAGAHNTNALNELEVVIAAFKKSVAKLSIQNKGV